MQNPYLEDSKLILPTLSQSVRENMTLFETIQTTLLFAVSIERLLKAILWSTNPVFVLEKPDFNNVVPTLYADRLLADAAKSGHVAKKPVESVISFRKALGRCQALSDTALSFKGRLYALGRFRDIIAHRPLQELNVKNCQELLLRDYYPLIDRLSGELGIDSREFLGHSKARLSQLASRYQSSTDSRLQIALEHHEQVWNARAGDSQYSQRQQERTTELLHKADQTATTCPSCGNTAVLKASLVFQEDPYTHTNVCVDRTFDQLYCFFCKLRLEDPAELDAALRPARVETEHASDEAEE